MTDLNHEDRALIDLARGGCEPTETDRRRVRTALVARLGAATGLMVTTTLGTSMVSSAAAVPLVTKVITAVVVAAAVGGGGIAYRAARIDRTRVVPVLSVGASGARTDRSIAPRMTAASQVPAGVPSPPAVAATSETLARPRAPVAATRGSTAAASEAVVAPAAEPSDRAPPLVPPELVPPPFPAPAFGPPALAAGAPVAAPASSTIPPAALTPTTIEEETRLVRAGIAALHAGHPARALALFDRCARVYPNGVLAQERSAERIIALCDLGRRADARAAVAAFLRVHPGSPLAARVRSTCGVPSNP